MKPTWPSPKHKTQYCEECKRLTQHRELVTPYRSLNKYECNPCYEQMIEEIIEDRTHKGKYD